MRQAFRDHDAAQQGPFSWSDCDWQKTGAIPFKIRSELPSQTRIKNSVSVGQTPPSSVRALAERLLALEVRPHGTTEELPGEAVRVLDHLGTALARFAGSDGSASLVRRALALARADDPALRRVSVKANGSLEGLERVSGDAVLAIIAHFLGLLVTFVGEPLTLGLVRDAWPDASLDT